MKKLVILVLLLTLGSGSIVFSQVDLKSKEYDIGFSTCLWLAGDVYVGGSVEKDASFLFRGFIDAYLMPKFAVGAYVNIEPISQDGVDIMFYELGASLKPRFFIGEDMAFKPGLNIGYRGGSIDDVDDNIEGMAVNMSSEIQKAMETMILSFEGGFLSQPVGGIYGFDVDWAPIMYIGVGVTF